MSTDNGIEINAKQARMCDNNFCSKFDFRDGRLVINLNANTGRWCPVYSFGEEHHQRFISKFHFTSRIIMLSQDEKVLSSIT